MVVGHDDCDDVVLEVVVGTIVMMMMIYQILAVGFLWVERVTKKWDTDGDVDFVEGSDPHFVLTLTLTLRFRLMLNHSILHDDFVLLQKRRCFDWTAAAAAVADSAAAAVLAVVVVAVPVAVATWGILVVVVDMVDAVDCHEVGNGAGTLSYRYYYLQHHYYHRTYGYR